MAVNKIKLPHLKRTKNSETIDIPVPEKVVISMSQHMGAPCRVLVNAGDWVKAGQKIGEGDSFLSCPVHSSVSGKVTEITDILRADGKYTKAVVIASDGLQIVSESVTPPKVTNREEFIKAVKESGLCGLGGAGFPTHVKLSFDKDKTPVDSLIINAAECEPYITSDYRELMENSEDVLDGIKKVQQYLGIKNVYICIEDNKAEAVKLFEKLTSSDSSVKIVKLKSLYPQGAEKVVIYSATRRIVGEGELPVNRGVIVLNVTTVGFISRYLKTGMPLVSRRITVDGDGVRTPCNVRVPIGISIRKLAEFADGNIEAARKIILGGPMMGTAVYDPDAPVCKTNNAVLVFIKEAQEQPMTNCIRCARCINACPINLMPAKIEKAYKAKDISALVKLKVNLCMNCGSCSYVCPAKRELAHTNQLAKELITK